jgi:signal transduction histidine kinase
VESDLRRLCDGLLKSLESDRVRVAGLLGDELVPVITMARYLIEGAAQRIGRGELGETAEALNDASWRIRDAVCQLLALCSDLRPRVLADLGLLPALAWYLREFSRQNRAIHVSPRITVTEEQVPADLKLAIFRIVQAALNNVAGHSKASSVRVSLSMFEDELRLGIEDNGVGFNVERRRYGRPGHGGCGLGIIQRWVESTAGLCSIASIPRHGARVQAFWRVQMVAATAQEAQEPTLGIASAPPI